MSLFFSAKELIELTLIFFELDIIEFKYSQRPYSFNLSLFARLIVVGLGVLLVLG